MFVINLRGCLCVSLKEAERKHANGWVIGRKSEVNVETRVYMGAGFTYYFYLQQLLLLL